MNMKRIFLLSLLVLLNFVYFPPMAMADENEPEVTRWKHPEKIKKPKHVPDSPQAFAIPSMTPLFSRSLYAEDAGRVCIVVHKDVYAATESLLLQYEADISDMGFNTLVLQYNSGGAEDVRATLAGLYSENESLSGAVLVGNIPYIIYEMIQNWGSGDEYEDFPCDIFYMDLNGTWSDTLSNGSVQPENGKYDTRGGNLDLEIWVSRLYVENLTALGSETDILNAYFDKNHRYRIGLLNTQPEALVYNDDDWDYMASQDKSHLSMIYDPLKITEVSDTEQTTAADFIGTHLAQPYEFMLIRSHGWPGGHGFYRNSKSVFDYVYESEYPLNDPDALFYSLFVCSGADYTENDYLAGTISFNPDDSGLLSIGSTKTGGMWNGNLFYNVLGNKKTFGEAFRLWFNNVQSVYPSYTPRWWYGMVLIGDAALVRSEYLIKPCKGDLFGDGDVDLTDLEVFTSTLGSIQCTESCLGDFDDDGNIDGSDLAIFVENFGRENCP